MNSYIDGKYWNERTIIRVTPKGPAMYEDLVCEGDLDGNRYAIVKLVDKMGYSWPFSCGKQEVSHYLARIDVSPYENDVRKYIHSFLSNNVAYENRNTKVFEWSGSDFLQNNCGVFLGNISPSYWRNGFGKCEYIQFKICTFKNLQEKIMFEIKYGGLFSNADFTTDVMGRIRNFLTPIFDKLGKSTRIEPKDF